MIAGAHEQSLSPPVSPVQTGYLKQKFAYDPGGDFVCQIGRWFVQMRISDIVWSFDEEALEAVPLTSSVVLNGN